MHPTVAPMAVDAVQVRIIMDNGIDVLMAGNKAIGSARHSWWLAQFAVSGVRSF